MRTLSTLTGIVFIGALIFSILLVAQPRKAHSQVDDILGSIKQYGAIFPGISCKTRTNNEATVRNLMHGVFNRDSDEPVALNCGMPTSYPFGSDTFANNTRILDYIYVFFGREANVSDQTYEETFCNIYVSAIEDTATSPASSSTAVSLGQVRPVASGNNLMFGASISTSGATYPSTFNFYSAFCKIPRGVRIQGMILHPHSLTTF